MNYVLFDENGDFKSYTKNQNTQQNYALNNLYYFWKIVPDEDFSKNIYFKNGEFGYAEPENNEIIQREDFDVEYEINELKNRVNELTAI